MKKRQKKKNTKRAVRFLAELDGRWFTFVKKEGCYRMTGQCRQSGTGTQRYTQYDSVIMPPPGPPKPITTLQIARPPKEDTPLEWSSPSQAVLTKGDTLQPGAHPLRISVSDPNGITLRQWERFGRALK